MAPTFTHYQVLGVAPSASPDEIRAAYRRQARRHHPDAQAGAGAGHNGSDASSAGPSMAAVNAAWHALRDAGRRHAYDVAIGYRRPQRGAAGEPEPWGGASAGVADSEFGDPDFDSYEGSGTFAGAGDEEDGLAAPARPADLLVMLPVLLILASVGIFFFSTMAGSVRLRALALILVPIATVGFVAAPLLVMLRGRDRRRP